MVVPLLCMQCANVSLSSVADAATIMFRMFSQIQTIKLVLCICTVGLRQVYQIERVESTSNSACYGVWSVFVV